MRRNSSNTMPPLSGHAGISKILFNATFPLPQVFPLFRSPLCTSFEGTHGTAPQGATLGTRIIGTFLSLCHCALCAGYATTRRSRLYLSSSLALDAVGALRLHTTNKHIPLISTLNDFHQCLPTQNKLYYLIPNR